MYKFKLIDESRYDAHLIQRQNRGLRIFSEISLQTNSFLLRLLPHVQINNASTQMADQNFPELLLEYKYGFH